MHPDTKILFNADAGALDLGGVTQAVEHNIDAPAGKAASHAKTNTAGGTGDHCCFG